MAGFRTIVTTIPGLDVITRIEGVIGVHSSFVLRKAVDTTALPLTYARTASS